MAYQFKGHEPVLLSECISYWVNPLFESMDEIDLADLTFGGGGHSFEICSKFSKVKILGLDQDQDVIENAKSQIKERNLSTQIQLKKMNFQNFSEEKKFHGILIDLGISSHQIDTPERGMSFRFNGPLDMRMDYTNDEILTAQDIVNNFSQEELAKIFFTYGEERFANRISQRIVEERKTKVISTTSELEEIVFHCYPKRERFSKTHPATRVFQALRLAVNSELEVLNKVMPALLSQVVPGGRILIISFHSLEDRIVKQTFKLWMKEGFGQVITKRPIIPTDGEIAINPRSRSAKLRVFEKQ